MCRGEKNALVVVAHITSYSANADCSVVLNYSEYSRISFSEYLYSRHCFRIQRFSTFIQFLTLHVGGSACGRTRLEMDRGTVSRFRRPLGMCVF